MIKENVVSFDFDGTLSDHFGGEKNPHQKHARDFVLRLIRRGYDVYIITRRYGPDNSAMGLMDEHVKVLEVAKELGIPEERVIFTNREWKYSFIGSIGACMHIDDDEREKFWIERHLPNVDMIWLEHNNWDEQLIDVISEHNKLKIWFSSKRNVSKLVMTLIAIILSVYLLA